MTSASPRSTKTSVLSADLEIDGDLTSPGQVAFYATITGNIVADELAIEEGAEVHGDVDARRQKIDGTVVGAVHASEVTITSIGRVSGGVSYGALTVQAGAVLDGELKKMGLATQVPPPGGPRVE